MVLSFGLLQSGLFTESENTGVGMGSDPQQTIINEVATGMYYLGIYTGTGFNSTRAAVGTDTHNTTIQFTAAQLAKYNRIFINVSLTASCGVGNVSGLCTYRVESQETGGGGGGWSDIQGTLTLCYCFVSGGFGSLADYGSGTYQLYKVLTAGEKAAGLDIKITSTSTCGGTDSATVTNKQVIFMGAA